MKDLHHLLPTKIFLTNLYCYSSITFVPQQSECDLVIITFHYKISLLFFYFLAEPGWGREQFLTSAKGYLLTSYTFTLTNIYND